MRHGVRHGAPMCSLSSPAYGALYLCLRAHAVFIEASDG